MGHEIMATNDQGEFIARVTTQQAPDNYIKPIQVPPDHPLDAHLK